MSEQTSTGAVVLRPGTRLVFDGDTVEVAQLDGVSVTIRNDRTGRFAVLTLTRLVAGAGCLVAPQALAVESVGVTLASLTGDQLAEVEQRGRHVREVLTGRPDDAGQASASGALGERLLAKAGELGVTVRTLERWVAAYRRDGETGLVTPGCCVGEEAVWTTAGTRWSALCSRSG